MPLYVPGRRDGTVSYDERKSAELKADDVYSAYRSSRPTAR